MILAHHFKIPITHSHHGMLNEPSHSHEMDLEVRIEGALNAEGFVIDYRRIAEIGERQVVRVLASQNLDKLFEFPTSENIAIWVWQQLAPHLPLCEVIVREKPEIAAIYRGPDDHGAR